MEKYSKQPAFTSTNPAQPIGRLALQLVSHAGEVCHSMGSAVLVAPGVAATAAHIMDSCKRAHGFEERQGAPPHGDWTLHAFQFGSEVEVRDFLVDRMTASEFSDVAILRLRGNPDWAPLLQPMLTFRPPAIGERVVGFGYAGRASINGQTLVVEPGAHTSVGEVIEVFPRARDRLLAPYPCLHVNCRFDDAMSGGPVFTEDGAVCGVISRNMPPFAEGESHASVVSLIWPIVGLSPHVPWEERPGDETFMLYDYYAANPQLVKDLHRVARLPDGSWKIDMSPAPAPG